MRLRGFGGVKAAVHGAVSWLSGVSQAGDALPAAASTSGFISVTACSQGCNSTSQTL